MASANFRDNFRFRDDGLACALSDGASESFDSKTWAEILCESFNRIVKRKKRGSFLHEKTVKQFIGQARTSFKTKYLNKTLTWSQEVSLKTTSR